MQHLRLRQWLPVSSRSRGEITAALRKGDRVALIGFGTFSVSQRKARNGRNPQTGAVIKIAARKVGKVTPGAELKKAINRR